MVSVSPWPSMPKKDTGFPVAAMPSATRFAQPSAVVVIGIEDGWAKRVADADHHHRGDIGIGPGADQRLEMQLEVSAELQPPIGMRNRERSLDVVRHRFTCGVGEIVDGQDEDVVAHADATVVALVSLECRLTQIHALRNLRNVALTSAWS